MKSNIFIASTFLLATVSILLLNGCLKDTGTRQYYAYTPVYKTSAQVRAEIKSNAPQPITNPAKMCVLGNIIFLVEAEKGIHIIDNTNPSLPVNKAFITIPGNEDISVQGNILYADCYTDLMAIDISNPGNVVLKNYKAGIFKERSYINGYYIDSNKIITDWIRTNAKTNLQLAQGQGIWTNGNYVTTMVYSNLMSLSSSQSAASNNTSIGGSMSRMTIQNNHLYAVSTQTLYSISIAKQSDPSYFTIQKINLTMGSAETIYPFQDKLFIGSTSGMYIFSVVNPDAPTLLSTFTHASAWDPVITDGVNAFITLRTGNFSGGLLNELDIVNVQNIYHPTLIMKYNLTNPKGLSIDGNTLIVCDDGLKVYDATDPFNLLLKKTITLPNTYDVICINGLAIVSAKGGLYQFDYSNPAAIKLLSKLSINQ